MHIYFIIGKSRKHLPFLKVERNITAWGKLWKDERNVSTTSKFVIATFSEVKQQLTDRSTTTGKCQRDMLIDEFHFTTKNNRRCWFTAFICQQKKLLSFDYCPILTIWNDLHNSLRLIEQFVQLVMFYLVMRIDYLSRSKQWNGSILTRLFIHD